MFPARFLGLLVGVTLALGAAETGIPAIDVTRPVENLGHDPDAVYPANPRNLLTGKHHYDIAWLKAHLLPAGQWQPYPTAGDRARWGAVGADLRDAIVPAAREAAKKPWPPLTATFSLNYLRNGNRSDFSAPHRERQSRLELLTLAEALEGQGKFLDPITDAVWLISEETWWGEPAHIPQLQRSGTGLPNVREPVIDLFAAERGAALAWTYYLVGAKLDAVSPFVRERIAYEVDRRILTPFLARDDFWWMGLAERKDLNNWTPWITSNVLTCALLLEQNPDRRAALVAKCLQILDRYVNLYPADGGCDEGPGYWSAAGGALFDCLDLLHSATAGQLDVYDEPLVRAMGHFICDAHVAGDWALNFGDGSARARPNAALVYRFGRVTHDDAMAAYGAWLAHASRDLANVVRNGSLTRQLPAIFAHDELLAAPVAEPLPRDVFLPDLQMAAARDAAGSTAGLYFGIKGHHNAESHNHNDAGSFMLYADGQPVLIDVGVETYTVKTFSPQRYEIWTMQSAYHNLPTINGVMQAWGHRYAAADVRHDANDRQASVEMELAHAYPTEAGVESWRRRLVLTRGRDVTLSETYRLREVRAPLVLNFMTADAVENRAADELVLRGKSGPAVAMHFDATRLKARVEEIPVEDNQLRGVWGGTLRRIQLVDEQPAPAGVLEVSFRKN